MRKLASISIVFVGLLCFAFVPSLLSYLTFAVQGLANGDALAYVSLGLGALPAIVAVLIGLYLVYNRHYLASRLFEDDEAPQPVNTADIMRLVVLALALWLLIRAFTGTVAVLISQAQMFVGNFSAADGFPGVEVYWLDLIGPVASGVAGWLLMTRSQSVAAWLWRERNGTAIPAQATLPVCPACGSPYDPQDYESTVDAFDCERCGERVFIVRG